MCQFDVSRYPYPCHTFVYRLVHRCRQNITHCKRVDLRQKHIRKEEPCRHPEVCNWCYSMEGLGKDDAMKHWNEAKSAPLTLRMEASVLPMPEPALVAKFVEYDGTTYYVSPSEFQHRILPTLLSEANAKRAMKESKATKKDGTSSPVIVVTPDWKATPKPTATVGGLEAVTFTANHAAQTETPPISKSTIANHRNSNTETGRDNKSGAGYFIQPHFSPNQNQLSGQLAYEWKFNEGVDPQGRFVVAVNHRWNVQQFPERFLYQPWYTSTQPQNQMHREYYYPMYQQNACFF